MPMRPFTENYDDYLQTSEDEFADLENRSFEEQQLIRSAAERDPRQYRGIGYGGLTGEEKEAVAAAGMELPQNLVARENVQQKYRRAGAPKGFGFDKDTPSIAEKAIEAEKAGQSGEGSGDGEGPADIEGLTGTMDMTTAKRMMKTLGPYAAQLGLSSLIGMPAPMMAGMLAKRFGVKYGTKALKDLYGQVTGGGGEQDFAGTFQEAAARGDVKGISESYGKGMEQIESTARESYVGPGPAGINLGTFSGEDLTTPGFSGFAPGDPEEGDVLASDFGDGSGGGEGRSAGYGGYGGYSPGQGGFDIDAYGDTGGDDGGYGIG